MRKIIQQVFLLILCLSFVFSLAACSEDDYSKDEDFEEEYSEDEDSEEEYVIMRSGSMEPTIPVGAKVYYEPVDYTTLREGDIVVYLAGENTVVTHRIIDVVPDEEDPTVIRFRTMGDNNESPDASSLHYKNVLGKVTDVRKGFVYYYIRYFD